jgi:hypothetical protein
MESTIKSLIIDIKDQIDQLEIIHKNYLKAVNNGSNRSSQSLRIQYMGAKGKVVHKMKKLSDKIRGEIITVDLLVNGKPDNGTFVNLTEEDIENIYRIVATSTGQKIEILKFNHRFTRILEKS